MIRYFLTKEFTKDNEDEFVAETCRFYVRTDNFEKSIMKIAPFLETDLYSGADIYNVITTFYREFGIEKMIDLAKEGYDDMDNGTGSLSIRRMIDILNGFCTQDGSDIADVADELILERAYLEFDLDSTIADLLGMDEFRLAKNDDERVPILIKYLKEKFLLDFTELQVKDAEINIYDAILVTRNDYGKARAFASVARSLLEIDHYWMKKRKERISSNIDIYDNDIVWIPDIIPENEEAIFMVHDYAHNKSHD